MEKSDSTAIRWAIKKFWKEKTDDELAKGLRTDPLTVRTMREKMGLKGTESLKDFARRYLLELSEPAKREFMDRLPAELIWKMAEGSPATTGSLEISQEPIKIDITHQLLKVYGPPAARIIDHVPDDSEGSRITAGTGK